MKIVQLIALLTIILSTACQPQPVSNPRPASPEPTSHETVTSSQDTTESTQVETLSEAETKGQPVEIEPLTLDMGSESHWFDHFVSEESDDAIFFRTVKDNEGLNKLLNNLRAPNPEALTSSEEETLNTHLKSGGQIVIFFDATSIATQPQTLFSYDQNYTFISRAPQYDSPYIGSTQAPPSLMLYLLPDGQADVFYATNQREISHRKANTF